MRFVKYFLIALQVVLAINTWGQRDQFNDRKMAVYLTGEGVDENYRANRASVEQIVAVSGLPGIITDNLSECFNYGMILFGSQVHSGSFTSTQIDALKDYVYNGGYVVFSILSDSNLFELAGIERISIQNDRHFFSFISSMNERELRWIDEPYEREIKLGGNQYSGTFSTCGYWVNTADVFAQYINSNEATLIKNKFGAGYVYSFGFEWRDVIIRNLLDQDLQANRIYSNAFEASADVIMLLIRGIFLQAVPHAVWLSPAPWDSRSVFIITHDVCSHTAHLFANDFAEMELERGISATYNITTHQFLDDINGDNYSSHIWQMKSLVQKNHVIGSHSYGHFPDFASAEIFPVGEPLQDADSYNPGFSVEEGRTIGGTVYGELGVSKMLLDNDLNYDVKVHRSGHLAVNPAQYDILNELGYRYSSSFTSPDVLTGFPFYMHQGRDINGAKLPIIEIPLTISDVFGTHGAAMDEFNWMDKAELWLSVLISYSNNNSMTTLLVHPNRAYKLDAIVHVLDHMPADVYPMELTHYADFWKAREQVEFSSTLVDRVLKIYTNDAFFANDAFTFVFDLPQGIESVELYNANNQLVQHYQKDYYLGTSLVFQKSISELKNQSVLINSSSDLLYQNIPNPFQTATTINYTVPENGRVLLEISDASGRLVKRLVNEYQSAGEQTILFNGSDLSSGLYYYKIEIDGETQHYTSTLKMVKN